MTQETTLNPVKARELRNTLGRFVTGTAVVTTFDLEATAYGAMATTFNAISVDPPLAQITLARSSKAAKYLKGSNFVINVLAADQLPVAQHFAGAPLTDEPGWEIRSENPVLVGNAATLHCRQWNAYDGGDHIIVVGEILSLTMNQGTPLLVGEELANSLGEEPENELNDGWVASARSFRPLSPHRD